MTIHPEYPNKIFAEYFQWQIDNEDQPLPAPLQQAFHKEEHRINEWLKEHYQELKTAWAFEIYESLDIGDLDDWLTCAYWMTTLYRDDPPLVETGDPYDSIIGHEWAKISLPPDIECLLTAAVDWCPAVKEKDK